jgi:hypothetical protein
MTAAGQSRKSVRAGFAALCAGLALAVCGAAALHAATTERVVADPHTGLALYGFDPVAYFTEGQPAPGAADFEYRFAGVSWRFRNAGNRAAFAANPEIYTPRFGGYDPLGVARGICRECGATTVSICFTRLKRARRSTPIRARRSRPPKGAGRR